MASNLTGQVRNIAQVTTAVAQRRPVPEDHRRRQGRGRSSSNDTINTMVDQLLVLRRRGHPRRPRGRHRGQARRPGRACPASAGTWKDLTDSVNSMAGNLTAQVRNIAQVTTAVANGDLTQKITVDVRGRDPGAEATRSTRWSTSCRSFADEVTRVAREVGTEGKLGGQAEVQGVSRHLEGPDRQRQLHGRQPDRPGPQHRRRSPPRWPRATCRRRSPSTPAARSLELKDTINTMVDQLSSFADEVTRVAREVGTEGKLGGQAQVHGRRRHLEGPDRQRQPHGRQPDRPGPQHRPGHHRGRPGRPVARRSPSTPGARSSS